MADMAQAFRALADGFDRYASRDKNTIRRSTFQHAATRIRSVLDDFPATTTYTQWAWRDRDGSIHPLKELPIPEGAAIVRRTVTAWEAA